MPRMLTPPTPPRSKWDDIYKDLDLSSTVDKEDVTVYEDGVLRITPTEGSAAR